MAKDVSIIRQPSSLWCLSLNLAVFTVTRRAETPISTHPTLVGLELKKCVLGNSLVVQWLGLRAFTAEGPDSIPGQKTKTLRGAGKKSNREKGMFLRSSLGES